MKEREDVSPGSRVSLLVMSVESGVKEEGETKDNEPHLKA